MSKPRNRKTTQRATKVGTRRQRTWPMRVVLRYANAKPAARSWRRLVLGPFIGHILPKGTEPPETPAFGIESLADLQHILAEYRGFLARVVIQTDPGSLTAVALASELAAKAKLEVGGFGWDLGTKRLMVRWDTKSQSFSEMLYSYLALALQAHRYDALFQCPACGKFDWQETEHHQKYCSPRCRNRVLVQQYRKQNPEKYRAYHRKLMQQRRAEGKE